MRIDILTLFPQMFAPVQESILKRATDQNKLELHLHDIREFGLGTHRQVDDTPYGGGAGMVLRADVLVPAIEAITAKDSVAPWRIYLSPRGEVLRQPLVEQMATGYKRLLLVCGHYEGIDQRVIDGFIDQELSIGEYVLTGGELPAMVLIDAVARHIPGVLGHEHSAHEESFSTALNGKKEYPHYTKPESFRDMRVPDVLLSGHHKKIAEWRQDHLT